MRNGTTLYSTAAKVSRVAAGAGGYVTGGEPASDGTFVVRTDTNGGYLWSPGGRSWTPLLQVGINVTEANSKYNYPKSFGAYDVAIAWTNSSVIYICQMGSVYRSTDKGVTWTKTSYPYNANFDPNDTAANGGSAYRVNRKKLIVDPAGTTVVGLWDPTATTGGLFTTTDSGTTWTKNSSVTATGTTDATIAIDRSSATAGSPALYQTAYIATGTTVYKSTTGITGTFSAIAAYPGGAISSMIATGGNLFVADFNHIYKYNGTAWSLLTTQAGVQSLALNYANTLQMVCFFDNSQYIASTDGGTTWTTKGGTQTRTATDIPWLATTREDYMSHGAGWFDPANAGTLIMTEGIGTWKFPSAPLTANPTVTWQSFSLGIDQLISQGIVVTPTGRVLYACQDRQFITYDKSKIFVYPKSIGYHYGAPNTMSTTAINMGGGIDYAADNESYVVGVSQPLDNGGDWRMGIATDGGHVFTAPLSLPANCSGGIGAGSVAVNTSGNIVWCPSGGSSNVAYPSYSTDGGNSWTQCKFAGVNLSSLSFPVAIHGAYYYRRICVVADKTVPNTFYIFIYGTDSDATTDAAYRGLWKSTDGGANFTRVYSHRINGDGLNYDGFSGKLKMVPGHTGHMIWASGDVGVDDVAINIGLQFSSNGGQSFTAIPGLYEPEDFCIGAPVPGAAYPSLMAYGYSAISDNTARGVFRCTNFDPTNVTAATWTLVSNSAPLGDYNNQAVMGAHPSDTFGRFYLGKNGLFAYDYQDKAGVT